MQMRRIVIGAVLGVLMGATPAVAQTTQHVASATALRQAMTERVQTERQTRETLRGLLQQDRVRQVAASLGLDVRSAEQAVATLSSEDLARLADPVRQADAQLAGGQNTIVISTTTLLLIIIIVILLAD